MTSAELDLMWLTVAIDSIAVAVCLLSFPAVRRRLREIFEEQDEA